MKQRLQPLFEKAGKGKKRQWTMENVIQHLSGIRKQQGSGGGVRVEQISQPTEQQQEILNLLGIKL